MIKFPPEAIIMHIRFEARQRQNHAKHRENGLNAPIESPRELNFTFQKQPFWKICS